MYQVVSIVLLKLNNVKFIKYVTISIKTAVVIKLIQKEKFNE